jgi:hypothetical protein
LTDWRKPTSGESLRVMIERARSSVTGPRLRRFGEFLVHRAPAVVLAVRAGLFEAAGHARRRAAALDRRLCFAGVIHAA